MKLNWILSRRVFNHTLQTFTALQYYWCIDFINLKVIGSSTKCNRDQKGIISLWRQVYYLESSPRILTMTSRKRLSHRNRLDRLAWHALHINPGKTRNHGIRIAMTSPFERKRLATCTWQEHTLHSRTASTRENDFFVIFFCKFMRLSKHC